MLHPLLNLFIVCNLFVWQPCYSVYFEATSDRIRGKIVKMAEELVIDVSSKIDGVINFKSSYYKMSAYQMGDIVYAIRHRYKRMFFLYSLALHKVDEGADTDTIVAIFEEVEGLGREAGNFIRMIQMWEESRMNKDQAKSNTRMRSLRTNEVKMWIRLLESEPADDTTTNPPPFNIPNVTNSRGKRRNGKWIYTGLDDI